MSDEHRGETEMQGEARRLDEVERAGRRIDTAKVIPRPGEEAPDGWQGEPPAEGTRRALILGVIDDFSLRLISGVGGKATKHSCLALADEIEQALIDATEIPTEVEREVRRLQVTVDRLEGIAEERWQRIGQLETDVEVKQATIDGFAATIAEQADQLDATRGRTNAWVTELAYQAAGAATRPLLEDHGDYVFPAERVQEAVAHLLETYFGIPRACGGCQEEQLEQGRQEAPTADDYMRKAEDEGHMWPKGSPQRRLIEQGRERQSEDGRDRPGGNEPAANVKFLEDEVERLLGGREEARTREGRFAEERDAAFALLRWLLPVAVVKRLD